MKKSVEKKTVSKYQTEERTVSLVLDTLVDPLTGHMAQHRDENRFRAQPILNGELSTDRHKI